MTSPNLFTNSATAISYTAVNANPEGSVQTEGQALYQQASNSSQPDVVVKRQFEQQNQDQKTQLANEFIESAGREGIYHLASTPDGQHALAVVYNHAGSEGRGFMREAHEEQGHTAIDYTQKDSDGASIGTKMQEGIVAHNGAQLGQTNQIAQAMQDLQTAPSGSFAAFEAALELPVAAPSSRNVESQNGVHSVSDPGLRTVSDGEFDAIESLFTKLDNFETGPYREGAGLKLEADGLSLSILRPWENPNFDYNASLVTGTASPVIGDFNRGFWKRVDNSVTGGRLLGGNSVLDQADTEVYSNASVLGIDGLTHGDVYDFATTAAEYLGYAELGLSAGSLKTFVRNLDADNAKYAADDMGSGNPLGIGQASNKTYPKSWDKFDPTTNAAFENRLAEFNGGNLDGPRHLRGGEGQLFLSDKTPDLALKRWFESRLGDMDESIRRLEVLNDEVIANPALSKRIEVVKVHERGTDWILRDFDPDSIPLKSALKDSHVSSVYQGAMSALKGSQNDMLKMLETRVNRNPPSANIHWSPTKEKILIIDML